jgi:hypothetical protein
MRSKLLHHVDRLRTFAVMLDTPHRKLNGSNANGRARASERDADEPE